MEPAFQDNNFLPCVFGIFYHVKLKFLHSHMMVAFVSLSITLTIFISTASFVI